MFIGEDLGNWSCQNKLRFFHRFQNLCKPQAFDSVAESLSSDEVWRSVIWFRVAKNTCQNVPIDHWELVSVVSKFLVGAWQCISMASLIRSGGCHLSLQWSRRKISQGCVPSPWGVPLTFLYFIYSFIYLFTYLFIYDFLLTKESV